MLKIAPTYQNIKPFFSEMLEVKDLANDERLQFARKLLAESNQQRLSQATLVKRKHHSSSSSIATNRPVEEPVTHFYVTIGFSRFG